MIVHFITLTCNTQPHSSNQHNKSLEGVGENNGSQTAGYGIQRGYPKQTKDGDVQVPAQRLLNEEGARVEINLQIAIITVLNSDRTNCLT